MVNLTIILLASLRGSIERRHTTRLGRSGLPSGRVSFGAGTGIVVEYAGARYKLLTLDADEFIRRFLIHVLPDGFHRIRH